MFRKLRLWKLRRQAGKVRAIVVRMDAGMRAMGLSRTQRRQLWRDVIKSANVRDEAFTSLSGGGG